MDPVTPAPSPSVQGVEEPLAPEPHYGRHLAFGVGSGTGIGLISAALRARVGYVALEGAAGYVPVLAMSLGVAECSELILALPHQFTGSALFFFASDQKKFVPGMRVAVDYIAGLKWGGMLGFEGELRLSSPLALGFGAGLKVIPEGNSWAEAELRERTDSACYFEGNPANVVFGYLNVQLLVYAF